MVHAILGYSVHGNSLCFVLVAFHLMTTGPYGFTAWIVALFEGKFEIGTV